jgi:hypothetical protein
VLRDERLARQGENHVSSDDTLKTFACKEKKGERRQKHQTIARVRRKESKAQYKKEGKKAVCRGNSILTGENTTESTPFLEKGVGPRRSH